jgi:hypothetical protein
MWRLCVLPVSRSCLLCILVSPCHGSSLSKLSWCGTTKPSNPKVFFMLLFYGVQIHKKQEPGVQVKGKRNFKDGRRPLDWRERVRQTDGHSVKHNPIRLVFFLLSFLLPSPPRHKPFYPAIPSLTAFSFAAFPPLVSMFVRGLEPRLATPAFFSLVLSRKRPGHPYYIYIFLCSVAP